MSFFRLPNALVIHSRGAHHSEHGAHVVEFEKDKPWKENAIFQWSREHLSSSSTQITHLELRKEGGTLQHEYVALFFGDVTTGTICRLDRSANPFTPLQGIFVRDGTPHCDTIQIITHSQLHELNEKETCLVRLKFDEGFGADISFVFLMWYAIQQDDCGGTYTLQKYNCYFFARMITLGLARHAVMRHVLREKRVVYGLREVAVSNLWDNLPPDTESLSEKAPLLLHDLRVSLHDHLLKTHIRLNQHELLLKTLLRTHVEFALNNGILNAVRDAWRTEDLEAFRREWVADHKNFPLRELMTIWETAWMDVWKDIARQAAEHLGNQEGFNWNLKWDEVCGEKVNEKVRNPYVFSVLPLAKERSESKFSRMFRSVVHTRAEDIDNAHWIVTEIELQQYIQDKLYNDSKRISRLGLGIKSSIYWQVRITLNRVWWVIASDDATFHSEGHRFVLKPAHCKESISPLY